MKDVAEGDLDDAHPLLGQHSFSGSLETTKRYHKHPQAPTYPPVSSQRFRRFSEGTGGGG